ncbi:hypothetical protein [Rhodococcus sp. HNM0569]|uniref:hypothetical protein n=1 Tax=Rhodococcus sp. HNM0569 TaxID=2716340 RepID=UPI00146F66F1|nr:hypothetical protein [Rhodococcus sp. HNM0569]NLU84124.1 hypothetical protein [Rhodococcus sp. HNM0569]
MTQQFPQYPAAPEPSGAQPALPPVDVGTARHLWWVVAVLGAIQGFAAIAVLWGDRDSFVDQLMDDPALREAGADVGRSEVETLFAVGMGLTAVIILAVTAVFVLFVRFMYRGKLWARTLLTVLGVVMVVWTVPVLFGVGTDGFGGDTGGTGTVVALGAVQILQAVAAVGAIVVMHRREADEYFRPGLSSRGQGR